MQFGKSSQVKGQIKWDFIYINKNKAVIFLTHHHKYVYFTLLFL